MAKGKIIKSLGGFYYIEDSEGNVIETRARGNFRHLDIVPLVGDNVEYKLEGESYLGYIEKIYPRKNKLLRPPVANIDQVVIFVPVKSPKYNLYIVDKVIALYEMQNLNIIILINKRDLDEKRAQLLCNIYTQAGFKTIVTNLNHIIEKDKEKLRKIFNNKTTALSGVSGAGKSTLTNYLLDKEIETAGVSRKTDRGRHTTRHVEIFKGPADLYILDTPGFSSIEIEDTEEEQLEKFFREFSKYKANCKFNNCMHEKEPGCSVKEAVENNLIAKSRYENYLLILKDIRDKRRY